MAAGYSERGITMTRPAGREGHWNSDGDDDEIVCPFPSVIVDGVAAVQTLAELRTAYPHMTPIIVGSVHQAALLLEGMAFRQSAPSDGVQGFFGRVVNQFSAARDSTDIDPRTYACARSSDIAKTLDAAEAFGVKDWLVARQAENEAAIMEFEDPDDPEAAWPPRGDWPDDVVSASRPVAGQGSTNGRVS